MGLSVPGRKHKLNSPPSWKPPLPPPAPWAGSEQSHGEWSHCTRAYPEPAPLAPDVAAELAALEQEHVTLEAAWGANDDPDATYPDRIADTRTFEAVSALHAKLADTNTGTPDGLWDWCLAQDREVILDLLAFCVARTVNAVQLKRDGADDHRFGHANRLAAVLGLDMTAWFTPASENYFSKVSKAAILDALREAKGDIAPAWNSAKKSELARIAERQIAGTGWLPAALRAAD